MYQITTKNGVIGYTDAPTYCYHLRSGSPQVLRERDKARATGIVYGGEIYNLPGHTDFDAETATVSLIDAGAVLNRQNTELRTLREQNAALEDALCEQDAANAEWKEQIEDALCELDEGGN